MWGLQRVHGPKPSTHVLLAGQAGGSEKWLEKRKFFLQCVQNSLVLLRSLLEDPSYSSQKQKERRKQKERSQAAASCDVCSAALPTPSFFQIF